MSRLNRNLAWFLTGLAMTVLVVMATTDAQAQQNWVRCKNLASGDVQSFPERCPANWSPL